MWWLAGWAVVAAIGIGGVVVTAAGLRFGARVGREAAEMWRDVPKGRPIDRARTDRLPAPVARYLRRAIGGQRTAIGTVHLRHGGTFRTALDGAWVPIRGEQYFSADPPAFIWWGRVRVAPGIWVDARDRSIGGVGSMLVRAESIVTIADSQGPELDQGALLRLLGEMTWFPTALQDDRYVTWTPIDDRRARATLRVGGREVAGTFEFGDDDLPRVFSAERYRDLGGGRSELTTFVGESSDFRSVSVTGDPDHAVLVPHRMVGAWYVGGERKEYVRFVLEAIDFDPRQ